jgi:hypothetical protein
VAKKRWKDRPLTVAMLKGSAEYRAWFLRLVEFSRINGTTLIDIALKEWAERHGFEPPPRR